MSADLSPAEAVVLLNLNRPNAAEALKDTLMELAAHGLVSLEEGERGGMLGMRKRETLVSCHDKPDTLRELTEPTRAVYQETRLACAIGPLPFSDLVISFRRLYGPELEGFTAQYVIPSLVRRGYVGEEQTSRLFGLFKSTKLVLTPEGTAARMELEQRLSEAAQVPDYYRNDPGRAMTTMASLGLMALLLPALLPIRDELAGSAGAGFGDGGDAGVMPGLDALALLNNDAWDALDLGGDSLDGGFDGGFGGDSGGGDGGGD